MVHEFKMPDLATTGAPVKILRWLVQPGEAVTRGQFLLEVETDKASMEVEGTSTGVFETVLVAEGDAVDAGTVIAHIRTGDGQAAPAPAVAVAAEEKPASVVSPAPEAAPAKKTGGLFARNRATADAGTKPPVTATAPAAAPPLPLSVARRTAAQRLQQSKQTIPHFYLQTSANAEPLIARRLAALPDKPAWDAFFVEAVHRAIGRFPLMACYFENGQLLPQGTDTVGVAADIEGELFVVPVESPGEKSVAQVSQVIRDRVAALRSGDPAARAMKRGVMTISNLGACNVENFIAIVNPPESAILAVGKVHPVAVAADEGGVRMQQRVNLSLSVDHRVVNGKYAADFLGAIVEFLES